MIGKYCFCDNKEHMSRAAIIVPLADLSVGPSHSPKSAIAFEHNVL